MHSFDVKHLSQASIRWQCLFLRILTFAFEAVLLNYHGASAKARPSFGNL